MVSVTAETLPAAAPVPTLALMTTDEGDCACPPMSAAGVVELRQYTLRPRARDTLIEIFERELIEPQEALGMRVGGTFRDQVDLDRFVWFRGFTDMATRRAGLTDFYSGPVWRQHGPAANQTMVDSDNVLLLHGTDPPHPVPEPAGPRPASGQPPTERVLVTVYEHSDDEAIDRWLATDAHPLLESALGVAVGTWRTLAVTNDFPELPVREDTHVFVWAATFPDQGSADEARESLTSSPVWRDEITPRLAAVTKATQELRLQPTARSQHPAVRRREAAHG